MKRWSSYPTNLHYQHKSAAQEPQRLDSKEHSTSASYKNIKSMFLLKNVKICKFDCFKHSCEWRWGKRPSCQ